MQLKMGTVLSVVNQLQREGMKLSEIKELPIYIGNDDELNGIHMAWYVNPIDANANDGSNKYFVEMINEDHHNVKLKGKAILIS